MQTTAASRPAVMQSIPLSQIDPSPFQTRKDFNPEKLKKLAEMLKQHTLMNPIVVRKVGVRYELIAGERRVRAAKLLGWETIEAKIEEVDDQEAAEQVVVENLQRDDLNPIEEAEGFRKLQKMGMTLDKIADRVGVEDKGTVSRALSLLELPGEVQEMLARANISPKHARYLSRINDRKAMIRMAQKAATFGWSVKETERQVLDYFDPDKIKKRKTLASIEWEASKGFAFTPHDQWVDVRGSWDRTKDMDTFLAELRGALLVWMSQHPYQLKAEPEVSDTRETQVSGTEVSVTEVSDTGAAESDTDTDSAIGSLRRVPQSVFHNPQDKRSLAEKLKQAAEQFNPKSKSEPRLPANKEEQAELEALAAKSPQAVYAWIYGKDHILATSMEGTTWKQMGYLNPVDGVRDLLQRIEKPRKKGLWGLFS